MFAELRSAKNADYDEQQSDKQDHSESLANLGNLVKLFLQDVEVEACPCGRLSFALG
jgi:hypothetical protein